MGNKSNQVGWLYLMTMFCYSAILNANLFFSMLIGFVITLIIVVLVELNDNDMVENALLNGNISPELADKFKTVFILGVGIFVALTTVIYNIITNIK